MPTIESKRSSPVSRPLASSGAPTQSWASDPCAGADTWQDRSSPVAPSSALQVVLAEPVTVQASAPVGLAPPSPAPPAPAPMHANLAELLRLLHPDALRQARADDVSAAVDRAFAEEFAILRGADTDVRSGEDELARSKKAVMCAVWMHAGDFARFVAGQPAAVRLTQGSFEDARAYLGLDRQSPSELLTLCCTLAVNDLGKSVTWADKVARVLGEPHLAQQDHDVVVERAARAGLVPCLRGLDQRAEQLVFDGLQMGSELNVPAWLQGEAPAGTLRGALCLRGRPEAFRLKAQEIYHDVAGANLANAGSWMLEPMSRAFVEGFRALDAMVAGEHDLDAAYRMPFARRAADLAERVPASVLPRAAMDVSVPQGMALLRLLSLARVVPLGAGQGTANVLLVARAFRSLPEGVRHGLVDGLAVRGIDDGQAIFPSMAPEMFVQGLGKLLPLRDPEAQRACLQVLMQVLARALSGTRPEPGTAGFVELRDLRPLLPLVRDAAFAHDPGALLVAAQALFPDGARR